MNDYRQPDPALLAKQRHLEALEDLKQRIKELNRTVEIERTSRRTAEEESSNTEKRFEELRKRYNRLHSRRNPQAPGLVLGGAALIVAIVVAWNVWVLREYSDNGIVVRRTYSPAVTTEDVSTNESFYLTVSDGLGYPRVVRVTYLEWLKYAPGEYYCSGSGSCEIVDEIERK